MFLGIKKHPIPMFFTRGEVYIDFQYDSTRYHPISVALQPSSFYQSPSL